MNEDYILKLNKQQAEFQKYIQSLVDSCKIVWYNHIAEKFTQDEATRKLLSTLLEKTKRKRDQDIEGLSSYYRLLLNDVETVSQIKGETIKN